jgi:hypothetical protein
LKSLNKSWKSWKSQFISAISMKISTQLNLNWKVLILKNLDPAKKKSCLDSKDNLYRLEKLISTPRLTKNPSSTFSCYSPNLAIGLIDWLRLFSQNFDPSRFLPRLLRRIEIVKICWDPLRFVEMQQDLSRNLDIIETF